MNAEKSSPLNSFKIAKPPHVLVRAFGRLKVRQKLAVLHNTFFCVLAVSVYLSLIPLLSEDFAATQTREFRMYSQLFSSGLLNDAHVNSATGIYDLREGTAAELHLSSQGQQFLNKSPNETWHSKRDALYRLSRVPGRYVRLSLSSDFYDSTLRRTRMSLFAVLGTIYLLSVVVLEFIIMPQYVYQPLSLMLRADEATQKDDREHEMIDDRFIMDDEIGQIMSSRNMTVGQLRKQEDSLAGALQKLEEQDRLVSLGLLSTSVAHELNTPLTVLQGSIEKLLETSTDAPTLDRLNRMLRVTQRLRKISEGLVDFARVRTQLTESLSLRSLIEESWNLVAIDEKAGAINFSNNVSENDFVLGNGDRLVQVFVNLLRNALLAVSENGQIQVESRATFRAGQHWVCCRVLDDGPGIPAHVLPNMFEAFVSTRLDARGTGLGLTVAEGIVTQHGGVITAVNRPTGGAALEVTLPAARQL